MAEVTFDHVEKVYTGGVVAIRDFSLQVHAGEFLVVVGPSGCGKTTLLRLVAGLEDVTAGTLSIGGRVVNRVPPKDRDVAMVFQNHAIYPHLTAADNLAFGLKLRRHPASEINRRVDWAANMLGIREIMGRRPDELSGGQRQRVALGRAIVRQPRVFLFDEPLSNLDARLRVEMRAELKRLHQQLKTTAIYVTHDQEEALTLAQRVAVIDRGRLQQCGPPSVLYRQPANQFVAGFIGSPPMNIIPGTLVADAAGALWFESPPLRVQLPPAHQQQVGRRVGQTVALGVRPEALEPCPNSDQSEMPQGHVRGVVESDSFTGPDTELSVRTESGQRLVVRSGSAVVRVGDPVSLSIDVNQIHVFAPNRATGSTDDSALYGENLTGAGKTIME